MFAPFSDDNVGCREVLAFIPFRGKSSYMQLIRPLRYFLLLATLLCSSIVNAQTKQLTFDEVEFASVDGLTVEGVTFGYTKNGVSSPDAHYASFGPGSLMHVSDPSLVGDASGLLSITFDVPTPHIEFGLAVSRGESVSDAASVNLFDAAGDSVGVYSINTTAGDPLAFSEALFSYDGAPVAHADVSFAAGFQSFAMDNLVYVVPEPSSMVLASLGALAAVARRRRQ